MAKDKDDFQAACDRLSKPVDYHQAPARYEGVTPHSVAQAITWPEEANQDPAFLAKLSELRAELIRIDVENPESPMPFIETYHALVYLYQEAYPAESEDQCAARALNDKASILQTRVAMEQQSTQVKT